MPADFEMYGCQRKHACVTHYYVGLFIVGYWCVCALLKALLWVLVPQ